MTEVKFSVSMCVYGGDNAEWFDEALHSVFQQTRMPDEVVLVVDGPVPDTIDTVIERYQSVYKILSVYRLETNMGHGNARREGFSHCSYDYVAIADADDINTPDRFEKQLQCFEKTPGLSAVSSACYHFSGSIDHILNEESLPETDAAIKHFLKRRCPLCQASAMLNRKAVQQAGGYLDWYNAEDYYLWVRMYLQGAVFENCPERLLYVRSNEEQMNRRGGYPYFSSMKKLYRFMLKNKVIGVYDYLFNVTSRFAVQVLMPAKMRAFIRKKML